MLRAVSVSTLIEPRPGPGAVEVCRRDARLCRRLAGVSVDAWPRAAAKAFAKISCSPIAVCQGRRFCRFHRIGARATLFRSTSRLRWISETSCATENARAPKRSSRPCWPRYCRRAWRTRFPYAASDIAIANVPDRNLAAIAQRLKRWQLKPTGSEGWPKAEVTAGGIDTAALSSRTMEARDVPGLFAIGEAVDVTGWLGGYNFQWAWSSGWCAGQAV